MRRVLTIARRPAVWLTLLTFPLWLWLLCVTVPPPPTHVIPTGVAGEIGCFDTGLSTWAELVDLSDDACLVTYQVIHTSRMIDIDPKTRPVVVDTRTGADVTPRRWVDPEAAPVTRPDWQVAIHSDLWKHQAGRTLLRDEAVWDSLRQRFPDIFNAANNYWFQVPFRVSPDGLVVAYPSRDGKYADREKSDGITVEETRTGRRVAFLPTEWDQLCQIASGGKLAILRRNPKKQDGEQSRWALWDLETSTVRAELDLPGSSPTFYFSPDGQFVFAVYFSQKSVCRALKWWDTTTNRQVGQVDNAHEDALVDGGRVLVTKPLPKRSGSEESYRLCLWDVSTGASLGERALPKLSGGGDLYTFAGTDGDRLLVANYDPEHDRRRGLFDRAGDKVYEWAGGGPPPDRKQVVVWDTAERREVLRVPGSRPVMSANGRWLATINSQGVIRVWDVSARPAWWVLAGLSLLGAVCTTVAVLLTLRLVRRACRFLWWWWPGRVMRWTWRGRIRRRWVIALAAGAAIAVSGWGVYAALAAQAQEHLATVFEEVSANRRLTEADVTALVGWPPETDPLVVSSSRTKGVQMKHDDQVSPPTHRRWCRFGAELNVHFGADGTIWGEDVTDPDSLEDRLARWLGL